MWQQLSFISGILIGVVLGTLIGLAWASNRITALRVALGDLVRAVDEGNWRPYRETKIGQRTLEAMERAREVLGR